MQDFGAEKVPEWVPSVEPKACFHDKPKTKQSEDNQKHNVLQLVQSIDAGLAPNPSCFVVCQC